MSASDSREQLTPKKNRQYSPKPPQGGTELLPGTTHIFNPMHIRRASVYTFVGHDPQGIEQFTEYWVYPVLGADFAQHEADGYFAFAGELPANSTWATVKPTLDYPAGTRLAEQTYTYSSPPGPVLVANIVDPTNGYEKRLYKLFRNGSGTGALFRESWLENGSRLWADHWILDPGYMAPNFAGDLQYKLATGPTPTLKTFLRNGDPFPQGTLYVRTAYTFLPF